MAKYSVDNTVSPIRLTVLVEPEELQAAAMIAAEKMAKSVTIAGFERGAAPAGTVLEKFKNIIMPTVYADMFGKHGQLALEQNRLLAAEPPTVAEPYSKKAGKQYIGNVTADGLEFVLLINKIDIDVSSIFTQNFELITPSPDSFVEKNIESLLATVGSNIDTGLPATSTNKVLVEIETFSDDEKIKQHHYLNVVICPADNHLDFGATFNQDVIGKSANDTFTYFAADHLLTGFEHKLVRFVVTVRRVISVDKPNFDDEFAKKAGYESVEQIKEKFTAIWKRENKGIEGKFQRNAILNYLENLPLQVADSEIERHLSSEMAKLKKEETAYIEENPEIKEKIVSGIKDKFVKNKRLMFGIKAVKDLCHDKINFSQEALLIVAARNSKHGDSSEQTLQYAVNTGQLPQYKNGVVLDYLIANCRFEWKDS